jgi:hypothetical protein
MQMDNTNALLSDGGSSSYVDIYNATSNSWTRLPQGLGEARYELAAASLPSGLVFFAGGRSSGEKRSGCACQCCSCFLHFSGLVLPRLIWRSTARAAACFDILLFWNEVRAALTHRSQAAAHHRMLTFTMRLATAGPDFLKASEKLVIR